MQSEEEPVVLRLQSPDAVQHWAAIRVPSGARVSVGEVMHIPRAGLLELPHKASTLVKGKWGGDGGGEGRGGLGGDGDGGGDKGGGAGRGGSSGRGDGRSNSGGREGGDGGGENGGDAGQPIPKSGCTIAKQYPRSVCNAFDERPPSSTLNADVCVISNDTIAGNETSGGFAGFALKSVGTFILCVAIAYNASFAANMPASSVSSADGAIERLAAPMIAFSSNTLQPSCVSPSTSKKVVYMRSNAPIGSLVPARTNRKSNSAPRIVVCVPSLHAALPCLTDAPERQYDVSSPTPRQAKPEVVKSACEVVDDSGLTYDTST